ITNWAYGVTVFLTLASGTTMLLAAAAQDRERAATTQRYDLDRATSTVDRDIAALSGLARQFAISGNPGDLAAYRREASLLRAVEARTRPMRDVGARPDELGLLHDTMRWADALMAQQARAIAARLRGQRETALGIVFSPEYERELDRIQIDVERFQDRIDRRTDTVLEAATATSKMWRTVSEIVLVVTGLMFLCVLFFVFRQRVLRPVVRLSDVVTRLAKQDYAVEPPRYEQIDEIGDMAQALRVFREDGIARVKLERERDADRTTRDLLSRMTQRMQSCDTIAALEEVVRRFVPELAPHLAGRLYLYDAARGALVEACSWLDPVHSRADFPPNACWALRRGSPHRPGGETIDVPCQHLIDAADAMPDSICLPLMAQHGTLGLLFLERRPGADEGEFSEVYLAILAENVALALDNLRLRDTLRDLAMTDALTG
ncbi:HAMP domain-containing protein, partial [bacterium]